MDNNMDVYTLAQIKDFLQNGVNIAKPMFDKIIKSIAQGDMTSEKMGLLAQLANANIPIEAKTALVPAIEAAKVLSEKFEQKDKVESNVVAGQMEEEAKDKLTSEQMMQKTIGTAEKNGMTVVESSVKKEDTPHITFDINPQSKPYIDNLLLRMCDEKGIDLGLSKINASNKELFTIEIGDKDLTPEQKQEKINTILSKVNEVIETTDKNKDYEQLMPGKVKRMKQGFINDQPDINKEDYKVGYSNKGGVDSYYIIAGSKERAKEVAESLGYELDMTVTDGNKFRINASEKEIEGSKLEAAAEYTNVTNNMASTSVKPEEKPVQEPVQQPTTSSTSQEEEKKKEDNMFVPIAMAATMVAGAGMAMPAAGITNNIPAASVGGEQASLGSNVLQKKLGAYPNPTSNFKDAAYATVYMVMIIIMLAIAGFIAVNYLF